MNTKIVPETVHFLFTLKFIYNYFCLLFIFGTIYLKSSAEVIFATITSHWTTDSSVKQSISGVTLSENAPGALLYIYSIYDLSDIIFLFSQWSKHLIPLLVFSNSDVLTVLIPWYPYIFLHCTIIKSGTWKLWSDEYLKTIISDNVTTIDSFWFWVSLVTLYS